MLSIPHMIVVFIVVLVVFGPQKLPELARSLGKLMAEFRKASTDFKTAFEEEMRDLDRQALQAERKKAAEAAAASVAAEPSPPATLTTPAGTQSVSTESQSDTAAIAQVPESVPRSSEGPVASNNGEAATVTNPHDAPHDTQQPA